MRSMPIAMTVVLLAMIFLTLPVRDATSQQVYRCESSDGSITFSDLPCRSDIGKRETVDATPHQGHRPAPAPGERAYRMDDERDAGRMAPSHRRADVERQDERLPRRQRLTLERKRKRLLSGLKRRHVEPEVQRERIRALREVDRALGIGPADVPDMPFHDREVYEEHPVHPD